MLRSLPEHPSLALVLESEALAVDVRRGWINELKDSSTDEFVRLKTMVDKTNGDAKIGLERRAIEDLNRRDQCDRPLTNPGSKRNVH
jgi:hypothetical protein